MNTQFYANCSTPDRTLEKAQQSFSQTIIFHKKQCISARKFVILLETLTCFSKNGNCQTPTTPIFGKIYYNEVKVLLRHTLHLGSMNEEAIVHH